MHPNALSNAAYLAPAAVALHAYVVGPPALAVLALCAFVGCTLLAFGSWRYHRTGTRSGMVLDHAGMHAAFAGLGAWAVGSALSPAAGYAVLVASVVVALVATDRYRTLRQSHTPIAVGGTALFVGLLAVSVWEALGVAAVFGLAFYWQGHHADDGDPTGYSHFHAAWHGVSAVGMLVAALLVADVVG